MASGGDSFEADAVEAVDGEEEKEAPRGGRRSLALSTRLKDDEEEETALAASNGARRVVAWASRCSMVYDDGKRQSHGSKHAAAGIPSFAP